jgi:hypothetical protein
MAGRFRNRRIRLVTDIVLDAYAAVSVTQLIFFPCLPDPGQVDLLADAVL